MRPILALAGSAPAAGGFLLCFFHVLDDACRAFIFNFTQGIEGLVQLCFPELLEGQHVLKLDASVRTGLFIRDLSGIEEADQGRTGDA